MAVDSLTLASCGGEMGTGHGGGDDQPAVRGGDGAAVVYKKGAWSKEEDEKLMRAVDEYGLRNWVTIEKLSGLARPAKNCRLRWLNYLRPNLKKYPFTEEEERLILHLHAKYGNSWSRIAAKLPGRSDNEIKNFWHKRAKKCQKHHLPIYPQEKQQTQTNIADNDNDNDDCFFSNNGDFLAQNAHHSTDVSSSNPLVNSPQTPISISTTQSQFLSSPSSLVTSQKQSPTNDQNTPTSQTQNLLVSPHQTTTETPLDFTTLRKPPILSSPQSTLRRFSRSHSLVADSSPQTQWSSSTLVSPMEREDSPMASFSALQLKSPTTAPLSPLQLRLSMPVPSESTQPMTVDTDHFVANNSSPALENQPSFKFCQRGVNSGRVDEVEESESNLDIMEELKEAQERVRFLKRKLKERGISENTSLLTESSRNKNLVAENRLHSPLKNSTKKELLKRILKRKGDMSGISQVKSARNYKGEDLESGICRKGIVEAEKVTQSENAEILQIKEDTLSEIFERENSSTFYEQSQWIDLLDHINSPNTGKCSNECSTIEDLLSESSTFFQDSFLKGGVFGQSTEMTLVKPGYLQGEQFGYSIGQDVDSNLDVKSIFCANLIPNQYHAPDQLDSSYLLSQPIMENESCYLFSQQMMKQESSGGEQFYLQQEPCPHQSLLGGSVLEHLWTQEQMVSQDQTLSTQRFDSLVDPKESKNWNYETGEVVLKEEQEHENMDIIMPDDLSSLLEFFPTNNQTLEWYNNGDAITGTEAVHEFDKSSTSQPLISIADYI